MAYIEKRKKGYLVRVVLGYDTDGKRIVKNEIYHPTAKSENAQRKEALKYAEELERKVKNGELYNVGKLTLNAFFDQWEKDIAPLTLTQSKQEFYSFTMKKHFLPEAGYMDISKITPVPLQGIVTKMTKQGLKPKSIKTYFSVLSSIMSQAVKLRIIKENPCTGVTFPKMVTDIDETHSFTVEQSKVFLKALEDTYTVHYSERKRTDKESNTYSVAPYEQTITIGTMWKAYFTLALFGGLRRGEACALTWNDIDFEEMTVSITKSTAITKAGQVTKEPKTKAGNREIILPLPVFTKLKEWKSEQEYHASEIGDEWKGFRGAEYDDNFIFTQDNGKQINLYTPSHKLHEIIEMHNASAGINEKLPAIRLHDLRHCTASLLIASGADIATVSRTMGHSKISTTLDVYTHSLRKNDATISARLADLLAVDDMTERNAAYRA